MELARKKFVVYWQSYTERIPKDALATSRPTYILLIYPFDNLSLTTQINYVYIYSVGRDTDISSMQRYLIFNGNSN